jgi:hypothetical protein
MGHWRITSARCREGVRGSSGKIAAAVGLNAHKHTRRIHSSGQVGGASRIRIPGTVGRQSRSNQVSGRRLPKTGVFADSGGDFCRNGMRVCPLGSSETGAELQKPAKSGLFCPLRAGTSALWNAWLATQCRSHPSPGKFPANREFNREFCSFWALRGDLVARNRSATVTFSHNSLRKLTGKTFQGTGNFRTASGNLMGNFRKRLSVHFLHACFLAVRTRSVLADKFSGGGRDIANSRTLRRGFLASAP